MYCSGKERAREAGEMFREGNGKSVSVKWECENGSYK